MTVRIITGDCREILPTLPADSFDCVVTSPPYFGLRDYGVEGQIGLEPTLALYLETMVGVCRELRRVLKPGGTFWLNVGDSYSASASNNGGYSDKSTLAGFSNTNTKGRAQHEATKPRKISSGLKPKDLCMVPNHLAILLQDDGWYVRSEIIWHKPNPMPESVTDRPTCAHEKVWLLTKSEKYFYDAGAIAEPATDTGRVNGRDGRSEESGARPPGSNPRTLKRIDYSRLGRNARNVWSIASEPYRGAHYAVMPSTLAERCIKSGSPVGGSVLDPFGGAGTTGLVADRLGRNATLIELNPANRELGAERVRMDGPLFAEVSA